MASRGKPSSKSCKQWLGHLGGSSWRFLKSPNSGFTYKVYEKCANASKTIGRYMTVANLHWKTEHRMLHRPDLHTMAMLQVGVKFRMTTRKTTWSKITGERLMQWASWRKTTSLWKLHCRMSYTLVTHLRGAKDAARVVNVSIFERVCWSGVHTNWLSATFVRPNWARSENIKINSVASRSCTVMRRQFLPVNNRFFGGTQSWIVKQFDSESNSILCCNLVLIAIDSIWIIPSGLNEMKLLFLIFSSSLLSSLSSLLSASDIIFCVVLLLCSCCVCVCCCPLLCWRRERCMHRTRPCVYVQNVTVRTDTTTACGNHKNMF